MTPISDKMCDNHVDQVTVKVDLDPQGPFSWHNFSVQGSKVAWKQNINRIKTNNDDNKLRKDDLARQPQKTTVPLQEKETWRCPQVR